MIGSVFVVDDDVSIINILKDIIENNYKGSLAGEASSGKEAIEEIIKCKPDIILLDYLLPDKDGLQIIRAIKEEYSPEIIMISEVSDKKMIARAYNENISFFITKPINVVEVLAVINKVNEHFVMKKTVGQFKKAIMGLKDISDLEKDNKYETKMELKKLYGKLGIIGGSGCDELIQAALLVKSLEDKHYTLSDIYKNLVINFEDESQIYAIEKRIRRVILKAFNTMATLGVEDYLNPVFENYGGQLFDFVELRKQMRYLKGQSNKQGKINVKQFIESSIVIVDH